MRLRVTKTKGNTVSGWDGYGTFQENVEVGARDASAIREALCYTPTVNVTVADDGRVTFGR